MKKFFIAAGLLAVASLNSFGAACVDGTMASQPGFGGAGNTPCQVTNGSYSWDISNFFLQQVSQNGFGRVPTYSDIFVTFNTVGANGFSLTYSAAEGSPFFSWSNNDVQWTNGVWVTANNSQSNIVSISHTSAFPGTGTNNAYVSIEKEIQNQDSSQLHPSLTLAYPFGSGAGTGDTISTTTPFNAGFVSVNDRIVFDAKTITIGNVLRSGSITSYTNTFYAAEPPSEVPEPMTFVLMGAGLVGIAALRRRKA